jgi:hypothetical protein
MSVTRPVICSSAGSHESSRSSTLRSGGRLSSPGGPVSVSVPVRVWARLAIHDRNSDAVIDAGHWKEIKTSDTT